jgi:hypothetical protein
VSTAKRENSASVFLRFSEIGKNPCSVKDIYGDGRLISKPSAGNLAVFSDLQLSIFFARIRSRGPRTGQTPPDPSKSVHAALVLTRSLGAGAAEDEEFDRVFLPYVGGASGLPPGAALGLPPRCSLRALLVATRRAIERRSRTRCRTRCRTWATFLEPTLPRWEVSVRGFQHPASRTAAVRCYPAQTW